MVDLGPVDVRALAKAVLAYEWSEPPCLKHSSNVNVETFPEIREAAEPVETKLGAGEVIKRMITCLSPGQFRDLHIDPFEEGRVRVQVPITTNDRAWFYYEDEKFNLEVGRAYIVDTMVPHGVTNHGVTNRIHYIFDYRDDV